MTAAHVAYEKQLPLDINFLKTKMEMLSKAPIKEDAKKIERTRIEKELQLCRDIVDFLNFALSTISVSTSLYWHFLRWLPVDQLMSITPIGAIGTEIIFDKIRMWLF
mmetsp:Transcript_27663/g.38106  ORF Transcript_27663/g.38106 Transcript_27663/m.38106 type:complete len:107 (-) Transcript_27663:282-602(-)